MNSLKPLIITLLSVLLLMPSAPLQARIIGTESAISQDQRSGRIDRIHTALARQDVRQAMVALGVDPADATERVASLSDAELASLDGQLSELPAGSTSLIAVVGIVAVVLIILELVGVTDIFNNF